METGKQVNKNAALRNNSIRFGNKFRKKTGKVERKLLKSVEEQ